MKRSPKDVEESSGLVTRRGLVLTGVQLGFMGLLGLRMRQMQIEEAEEYRLLAEENRINMRLIPPSRGVIFDRNGVPIADNTQNYRIVIVREDAGDVDAVIAKLRGTEPVVRTAAQGAKLLLVRCTRVLTPGVQPGITTSEPTFS